MSDYEPNQCPQCGRFTGEGYTDPIEGEYSPGFWDYSVRHENGCHGRDGGVCCCRADSEPAACFCDESCADRFHEREQEVA